MNDNQTPAPDSGRPSSDESWQEVGRQFENFGRTLVEALRASWAWAETHDEVKQAKAGVETMLHDVGKAIEDTAATPEAQKLKEDASKTVESLRVAGKQSLEEARPQIVSALKQVNGELQKLIEKMEEERK